MSASPAAADWLPSASLSDMMHSDKTEQNDPFLSASTNSSHHRFSRFDNHLFALGPAVSPDQAKRALEAHLAETERRIQEASKLGTTLLQQRKDLSERLSEVEKQQSEGDITPELRQRLVEIEKEYHEVGRESARAFLPKSRASSSEVGGRPPAGDVKHSVSPSKFESEATSSPSKLSVPTRKQRNQPSNRVHDIEFATEISTSLLSQVRQLQVLLAEKEEALKTVTHERSMLELESERLSQRLKSLDESEHRYKDENWNLETQIHEFMSAAKEAADREKKLLQSLNSSQAEKSSAQKELDEIKLSHAKLVEDYATALKHHDVELGAVKRNVSLAEAERSTLQRKIEDLTDQNQELAKAVAHQRGRLEDRDQARGPSDEDFETAVDNVTPEHSPPPSPIKGTPRHSMLESETLKSSLHHAHRMIQNLKGNIHREKTEKLELKRMLQDARDELEARRNDSGLGPGSIKKSRKVEAKEFAKPLKPGQLGLLRSSRSEVMFDDTNWEDDDGQGTPSHVMAVTTARATIGGEVAASTDSSDRFDTANEGTDAFETANERGTETEDFQTPQEDLSDSDDLTETETNLSARAKQKAVSVAMSKAGNRDSFQSTASTSGDEYPHEDLKTPVVKPQKFRLRVSRGGNRRSRGASEEPQFQSSPASFVSSNNGTPQVGKNLFTELGGMEGSDDEFVGGTPNRSLFATQSSTPASRPNTAKSTPAPVTSPTVLPKPPMVSSGTMTEFWEPPQATSGAAVPVLAGADSVGAPKDVLAPFTSAPMGSREPLPLSDVANELHRQQHGHSLQTLQGEPSRPLSGPAFSELSSHYGPGVTDEIPGSSPPPPPVTDSASFGPTGPLLSISTIVAEHVEPREPELTILPNKPKETAPSVPASSLGVSAIRSIHTEPKSPESPTPYGAFISSEEPDAGLDHKEDEIEPPKPTLLASAHSWSGTKSVAPVTAENVTRQQPSDLETVTQTLKLQQPLQEPSAEPVGGKPLGQTHDQSAQTALTSDHIEELLKDMKQVTIPAQGGSKSPNSPAHCGDIIPSDLRLRKSQESVGSSGSTRTKMATSESIQEIVTVKRFSGSRKGSMSSVHPPLPTDHKQAISAAAQRSGSSSGGAGTMGPPILPASAYRASSSFKPVTPSFQNPPSPLRGGTTPRALQYSRSEVHSPTGTGQSRRSSVSSFVSEVDTRFNMRPGIMSNGIEPGTDPRMINAITQTMIGEYLWKYTRKAGRGSMSENRHRRYFWVHPYTRTLYWSDRDPSQAGRAELKAKSVPIEAVRVVTDDNPMPPGLHRKSLVIVTPGRAVKFTATTGQRHETWFNALSYLLLRTGEEAVGNTAEIANGLTREDVDEFNPGFSNNSSRQAPASLSSYNSRKSRRDSSVGIPRQSPAQTRIVQGSTSSRPSIRTFSRLSTYLKANNGQMSSHSTRRSRQSAGRDGSIYQASEVHDSAEDLREIIEKQDRESDKLEDVRACCDGKHHVGHLHSKSTKGRHSPYHASGTASTLQSPGQTRHLGRNSLMRRTE